MIGELSEKGVHNGIKNYIDANREHQEVKVGRFVADIKYENRIYEIQTKNFKKLRAKLDYYFRNNYSVTVVYPLEVTRYIVRDYGKRKAVHTGVKQDILYEMYSLLDYLDNDLFTLQIIEVEVNDYRDSENNKVKREIENILGLVEYHNSKEFVEELVPFTEEFTKQDFMDLGVQRRKLNPLKGLLMHDYIKIVGKKGNQYLYQRNL